MKPGSARDEEGSRNPGFQGPGGSPGGIGTFVLGLACSIMGGYLIMSQITVTSGYWQWWGPNTFGLTLIPLAIGIGFLSFNAKSLVGWIVAGASLLIIFTGVLSSLVIYFRQTSLFTMILMLALFAGGLGLMARAFRRY